MTVKISPHGAQAAEQALAIAYASADRRPSLTALFALDARLGDILRGTREPLVGQMRLTWWHDALGRLGEGPPPAEPVLTDLAAHVLPTGVGGDELATMIDGWEALLEDPATDAAVLAGHATTRGARLFSLAARSLGLAWHPEAVAAAGEGWALADVGRNLSDAVAAATARAMAAERLQVALADRWPAPLRALGALAWLARMDVRTAPRPPGHPWRVARLLRHRWTGR